MPKVLEAIAIPSSTPTTGIIVALHGWGANAADLAQLAPVLNLPNYIQLFPQAPHPHPQGGRMWYDFENPKPQISQSRELITSYLNSVQLSHPHQPLFLLGFSQGGAMTLDFLEFTGNLAGLISLSGYLHPDFKLSDQAPPVLIVHGSQDQVVPIIAAQSTRATLTKLRLKVNYHELNMGHEINPEAIATIRQFILANSHAVPSSIPD